MFRLYAQFPEEREREIERLKKMFEGGGPRTAGFEAQLCRTTEEWQQASETYRAKRSGVLQRIERARLFQAVNLPPPKDEEKVMRSQWEKDVEQGFASLDVPARSGPRRAASARMRHLPPIR